MATTEFENYTHLHMLVVLTFVHINVFAIPVWYYLSMRDYFIYYAESNIVCFIIFAIMFIHDLFSIDRQEKQLRFDQALIAFMLYFVSDTVWAGVISGIIPKTFSGIAIINLVNSVLMAMITYYWFRYALAVMQVPYRNKTSFRMYIVIPLIFSVIASIIVIIANPELFFDKDYNTTLLYSLFQVGLPIIYIISVVVYAMRRAYKTNSIQEKRRFLSIGLFPLMVVIGGLVQVVFAPRTPIFCFSSAILMILFYIQSMESQISLDPLTGLNNRSQLQRYISQEGSIKREGRLTYVVMMDVNDFKMINDTYGHSSGDEALVVISDALRKAAGEAKMPVFIGRYGGDEFIVIAHPASESAMPEFIGIVRDQIHSGCREKGLPYDINVGIGYDILDPDEKDGIRRCMERADKKLYINKREMKNHAAGSFA